MSGSAAYVLFYRRRHEAAADPPDQLQQLMEARALQVRGGDGGGWVCDCEQERARPLANHWLPLHELGSQRLFLFGLLTQC